MQNKAQQKPNEALAKPAPERVEAEEQALPAIPEDTVVNMNGVSIRIRK